MCTNNSHDGRRFDLVARTQRRSKQVAMAQDAFGAGHRQQEIDVAACVTSNPVMMTSAATFLSAPLTCI